MDTRSRGPIPRLMAALAGLATLLALGACTSGAPAAPASTPATAPSGAPTGTAAPSTPAGPTGVAACAAADLAVQPVGQGGAMGSLVYTVAVDNHRGAPCALASQPAVSYIDANGNVQTLPVTWDGVASPAVVVDPGKAVEFTIKITNGYGGYPTDSPSCAHPRTYRGIAVLVGGAGIPLPDLVLDVTCGDIFGTGWQPR